MINHSWLVSAMRDIRDYVVMNGLDHLVPVVKATCAAVEQELGADEKAEWRLEISPSEADVELALALDTVLRLDEGHFLPLSNLKRLSGRRKRSV
ncbi:MAG: hypothetical protein IPL38_07410 [Rhodobacter sp.]|nr:hypothetical protein [Rhodobacter sp.]